MLDNVRYDNFSAKTQVYGPESPRGSRLSFVAFAGHGQRRGRDVQRQRPGVTGVHYGSSSVPYARCRDYGDDDDAEREPEPLPSGGDRDEQPAGAGCVFAEYAIGPLAPRQT